jgi:hypothetical protein
MVARRDEGTSGISRVFISSTLHDLVKHRELLHHNLVRMYQFPVAMEDFGAGCRLPRRPAPNPDEDVRPFLASASATPAGSIRRSGTLGRAELPARSSTDTRLGRRAAPGSSERVRPYRRSS